MEDRILVREVDLRYVGHCWTCAVFDGHGGSSAAEYAEAHFIDVLREQLERTSDVTAALTETFHALDKGFLERAAKDQPTNTAGSTAVVALVSPEQGKLWVAHVGDSRAVLCSDGTAKALTSDHRTDRVDEVDRIRAAGGFIVFKRVMGELAVTRALGDLDYKADKMMVLPTPEIYEHFFTPADEFILLACDGLYDVLSNSDAASFVSAELKKHGDAEKAVAEIVGHSIHTMNSRDNVSAVLITLQ